MKKMYFVFVSVFVFTLLFVTCDQLDINGGEWGTLDGNGNETINTPITGVYAVGLDRNNRDVIRAFFWKDGVKTNLSTGDSAANAIAISEGSMFVAGAYDNGNMSVACYWKDGVKIDFSLNRVEIRDVLILVD